MDGMRVAYHPVSTGGRGETVVSNTIYLPSPTSVIAEISLATFTPFGDDPVAHAAFVACTTDGTNPPLPPSETFSYSGGSLSGSPRPLVIRNGLTSITYEIDVANCRADFIVKLFFWPAVERGNV